MRYKLLGRSGLRVSELCLGTMTFGEAWGWGASKAESRKIFETFVAAGGNFIDTGYPNYFLAQPHLVNLIYSGMFEQIDNHRG